MKNGMRTDNRGKQNVYKSALNYDIALLFSVLFLVGIGIVMVYSASSALAREALKPDYFFLKKQAVFGMIGIIVLVIFRHIPYKIYGILSL